MTPRSALRRLERLRLERGAAAAEARREALDRLSGSRVDTARDVLRCHEAACFARAYPDDARVRAAAERLLRSFGRRPDLRRFAGELADSGIAGTPIRYRFFWPTAVWLASSHARRLSIDWADGEFEQRLGAALPLLVTAVEAEALKRAELPPREAIGRLRARGETDAVFLLRRLAALPGGDRVREATHDALDVAYVVAAGPAGPSRTRARFEGAPVAFRHSALDRGRPDLARELRRAPRLVRALTARDGARAIDLAREAMVTRSRDLDAFAHGYARDVRLVDDGDGLAFLLVGVQPSRRLFLPAVYGALTLRNGVPIGYVQLDVLFRHAEVSYNTFATFRGAEAGYVFGRLLATTHHVFGASSFSVEPYQLGRGNEEGLETGAWWFYARCGFRPRAAGVARLARSELARRSTDPRHRSSRRVLERLASARVYWDAPGAERGTVTPIAGIGLAIARRLAEATGADRESAVAACEERVARRLGVRSTNGFTADERLWWSRWAPMLDALPALSRWPRADRASVVRVVRAKAGARESDFAALFDAHPRLSRAILSLA